MRLNAKGIIAEVAAIIIPVFLAPFFLFIHAIRVFLRLFDESSPLRARSVLITGATSGLGEALAKEYAKSSSSLILFGRNQDKLDNVVAACKALNSSCSVCSRVADLSKPEEYRKIMDECAKKESVDLVIAAAGIIKSTATKGDDLQDYMMECIDVNVKGTMNTILPFVAKMKKNGGGQICVVTGALGNATFGRDPIYEGSKNCIRVILEGMMANLMSHGVHLTIVSPGFMKTNMTKGKKTVMALEPEYMAEVIHDGVEQKEQFICNPYPMYVFSAIMKIIPASVFVTVNGWMANKKQSKNKLE